MFEYKQGILLWGSPNLIKAQLEFEKVAANKPSEILLAVNNIYKAMREDIGLKNFGLNTYS